MAEEKKRIRLLTVEDDLAVRQTITAYFEDCDFEVFEAVDGADGIAKFKELRTDIVLTDLRMPNVSGIDVVKAVHETDPETPVVVVSGTGAITDSIEAIRQGAWDYVCKPIVDMAVLEHVVRRVLERADLLKQKRHHQEYLEKEVEARTKEIRETNEQLAASLKEKTVLLQEIHHRVKNNLQVIASIINLQAIKIQDDRMRDIFSTLQTRIHSMSAIHEALYNSKSLSHINFADYINSMLRSLMTIYGVSPGHLAVELKTEDLELGIDQAVPCGLIINELVTNTMKYAFPDPDKKGVLRIEFTKDPSNQRYNLVVADNGIGLPQDFEDRKAQSLGMSLVEALTSQLGGEMTVSATVGTEFRVSF
jgi:two-component sensor histidine kinase/CheY-like chemotaxis protein